MPTLIKTRNKFPFRLSSLFVILTPALIFPGLASNVQAREFFDPAFLRSVGMTNSSSELPDLTAYETKNAQAPGEYRVDILLNYEYRETTHIRFVEAVGKSDATGSNVKKVNLVPCFSLSQLSGYGLRLNAFSELKENNNGCVNVDTIPDFHSEFNFNTQQLVISIPQAALSPIAQGFIPNEEFDDGINALIANYRFSGAKDFETEDEYYSINLNTGLNIGPWRLRNLSVGNKNQGEDSDWESVYLYAQRNIIPLKSTLLIGESSSLSSIFDGVPFTGLQLATDPEMLPDSLRGYAPVVRGIAKTNARVVIKQNGYQVYQAFVAPGAFEITDMYPTGGNGDLYVTVEESDGSKQNFIVPFATLPLMLREGQFEYELTSGQYRSYDNGTDKVPFTQATLSYGLLSNTTIYGGIQGASKYQSMAAGLGHNLGDFGAVSTDVTQAWSKRKDDDKTSGQSWRIRYGKNILETGTNITIAGYRYSTRGFSTLTEVLDTYNDNGNSSGFRSVRNRTNLTVNQNLGDGLGSLSMSGIFEDYWDGGRRNNSFGIGYNGGYRSINYYLGYSYSRYSWKNNNTNRQTQDDHLFAFNISIPLSEWLPGTYVSYQLNNSNPGSTDQYVSIGGSALENNSLSWDVQQGYSNRESASGGVRTSYRSSVGIVDTGYSYDKHRKSLNYGFSGGLLAHANGITFGQEMSDTAALVKAPGLSYVRLDNDQTISTDFRGYAILPYLTPYKRTSIMLDSTTLADNMELPVTSQKVVPTRGAIARANFEGNIGRRAFIVLQTASGSAVPYGATVISTANPNAQASLVSDGGMVYLSGLKETGELAVQWGKNASQQCKATYSLTDVTGQISQTTAVCR
ncbi:outer membrane usher protein [Klebsiella oxytoca]|uniref:Outer membrane usher protein n=1 Tax=Klebsiella oxytoca TaxID=571 RepID=A0A318FLN9_KLEOX|nr:fimbria/pilus outer membrane usher protein [Klebsiella oxytoca]PXW44440.1 outer membrane usher protein [Klebsiella oxytoca]HCB1500664.1 fimbrial biogenesis outer membrane usher protein [Klebsiella michiganensis]HCB1846829.1 fimbrial biogenesis outer membrane usher protein [Klebsiella oxytoca]